MSNQTTMVFWDVQHGHGTYVCAPNNRHIVVDLGTGSYGADKEFSPLQHLKNYYGIDQLDYVIISHPHVDHIDDIFNFDTLNPKVLLRPKHLDKKPILEKASKAEKPKLEKYFEISERYNQPISNDSPNNPKNPDNYGGLKIKSFMPTKCSHGNINNHSIVMLFEYAGIKALLPGDNEPPAWNELRQQSDFLTATKNIDVLLAPHHGRQSGFDNDTVNHLNPRITIVSDGRHCDSSATNRYSAKSREWTVFKADGTSEERKCVTTRNDGVVVVTFGKDGDGSFLNIKIS